MFESNTLIARLTALLESADEPGVFLTARAGNAYCLRSIRTSGPFFSLVLKGHKRIQHGTEVFEVVPGDAVQLVAVFQRTRTIHEAASPLGLFQTS